MLCECVHVLLSRNLPRFLASSHCAFPAGILPSPLYPMFCCLPLPLQILFLPSPDPFLVAWPLSIHISSTFRNLCGAGIDAGPCEW